MDEAFIKNTQDQIDDQDGHEQKNPQALQGALKSLGRALKVGDDGGRQGIPGEFLHGVHRLAQGHASLEVKRQGDRGELPRVVHRQGPHGAALVWPPRSTAPIAPWQT